MKLTVGKKLFFGFFAVVLLLVGIGAVSIYQIRNIQIMYSDVIEERAKKIAIVGDMMVAMSEERRTLLSYALLGDEALLESYKQAGETYDAKTKELETLGIVSSKHILDEMNRLEQIYNDLAAQVIMMKKQNNAEYLDLINGKVRQTGEAFLEAGKEMVAFQEQLLYEDNEASAKQVSSTIQWIVGCIIGIVLLSSLIAFFITRIISKPVGMVAAALDQIASGNLTIEEVKIRNRDEIGDLVVSLNTMVLQLRGIVAHVNDAALQVAVQAEELTASAEESAASAESMAYLAQASASESEVQLKFIRQVTLSMQEMAGEIQQIAKSSEDMLQATKTADASTTKGAEAVRTVSSQMEAINSSMEQTSSIIQILGERSNEISNITKLITNIAEQTNLLALNAAIEAARAGDAGKGFAVVAGEIRKLAEDSKKSAEEIARTITSIQGETKGAVSSIKVGIDKVSSGLTTAQDALQAFDNIENSVTSVNQKVRDVSAATEEINAAAAEIVQSVENAEHIAQQGVGRAKESSAATEGQFAAMEEFSASAQSLSSLSENLQSIISKFRV